jgi:transposase
VRLLATGDTNKNDPDDARSVAVAALRSPACRQVAADDHAAVLKVWSKRHRDLGRTRTQVACRLHTVLCELVPGGVSKRITAGQAARILESITPAGAVAAAHRELAIAFTEDLARIDTQMRDTKKKLTAVVQAVGTTVTEVFGVGPVVAATIIGGVRGISRFPNRDHFAAYNGTAPIEVSSGQRKIYRLSRRGNRQLNHAIHMAAVSQVSHRHRAGRGYYDRKRAEGKLQRSPALPQTADQRRRLRPPPSRRPPGGQDHGPGRATGERLYRQRGRLTPRTPALRPSHSRTHDQPTTPPSGPPAEDHPPRENDHPQNLLTQRGFRSARP